MTKPVIFTVLMGMALFTPLSWCGDQTESLSVIKPTLTADFKTLLSQADVSAGEPG